MLLPLGLLVACQLANHAKQRLVEKFHLSTTLSVVGCGPALLDTKGGGRFFSPFFLFRNSSPCSYLWWGWYSASLYDLGDVVRWYEIFVRVLRSSEVILLSYVNDTNLLHWFSK